MANWQPIGWTYPMGTAHKRHLVIQSGKHQMTRLACGPYGIFAIAANSRRVYNYDAWAGRCFCRACIASKWHLILEVLWRLGEIK